MSLENSNSKGKAVVKEEVFPLPPVEQKPFAFMISNTQQDDKSMVKKEEAVSLPILETAAPPPGYHQTPSNNTVSGSDTNNNDVLGHGSSSVLDQYAGLGSSSTTSASQIMQLSALQWGAIAVPSVTILPAFQQVDTNRRALVKDVLQHCVAALATADVVAANTALVIMSSLASADGDPLQRVAYAFAEALGRRALQLLPGVSRGLLQHLELPARQSAAAAGFTGATRLRFDAVCPLLRVAASVANHAIVTAMEGEEHVHVVDLGGASPNQWLELLRLFAAERPPSSLSLRLSVASDDEGLLAGAAWLLHQEAARLRIPFLFNPVRSHIDRLSPGDVIASLGQHQQEAMAIASTLQLHRLIADSIELPAAGGAASDRQKAKHHQNQNQNQMTTKADVLLRVLSGLSPKLMVLTEQEAYHNGATLGERVRNAFDYYAALFNDLEAGGATRDSADRAAVERMLLREEIMDIVARDGAARRERHEGVMGWAQRMGRAGFRPMLMPRISRFDAFADQGLLGLQLSFHATLRYWVAQDNTFFVIFANMTPMFSVTAWQPETSTTVQ